ncbi:MAG TPA: hypothetical protein VH415_11420 [Nitrososphaeraceae archaeon]|jgi:hypothetical protein
MPSSMKEIDRSGFKHINTDVIKNKITMAIKQITYPKDRLIFINQMISLSKLLMMYDLNFSTEYKDLDEKAQDPTYFAATFFDTNDIDQALSVHKLVRLLTRYILLYDKFFESGERKYRLVARKVRRSINQQIAKSDYRVLLEYTIDSSLKQFWAFWNFERIVKSRILAGYTFSYKEIRNFNQFKSSDASLVYAMVLDAALPNFNENISLIFHYNQALLDLLDDWEDIEDDVQGDMPNVFVMASLGIVPYNKLKKASSAEIRSVILKALDSSSVSITRLVNEYQTSVRNISVPDNFVFLKAVSDYHADSIRKSIL